VVGTVDPKALEPIASATPLVRAKGAEIGARSEIIPNLQSSLAFWYLTLASELVFSGDTGTTEPSRPSKRIGVEWSNHYTPRPWLLLDVDLAWTRARFSDNDPAATTFRRHCRPPRRQVSRCRISAPGRQAYSGGISAREI
jgi:hypothetical protein